MPVAGGLDQHVRQDRNRVAALDHRLDVGQTAQQLGAFDGGFHRNSDPLKRSKVKPGRPESPTSAGIRRNILSGAASRGKDESWSLGDNPQANIAMPPLTCSVWPVTYSASRLAR